MQADPQFKKKRKHRHPCIKEKLPVPAILLSGESGHSQVAYVVLLLFKGSMAVSLT